MAEFTNYRKDGEITGYSPDISADYSYPADFDRTYDYMMELFHQLVKGMSNSGNDYIILKGGNVTDAGGGKINISECWAAGDNGSGKKKLIYMPAKVNLSLPSGYNDNRQIWVKLQYADELGSVERTHWNGESYHYTCVDSYVGEDDPLLLFTDSDPTGAAVVLGSFKMNGTTFSAQSDRSDEFIVYNTVPAGSVQMYAGSTSPVGWFICDGSEVSRSTYRGLFNKIGTTWGTGDGSTTFNLPDFRGIFPKGAGTTSRTAGKDASGNAYSATLGAYSQDQLQGHWHNLSDVVAYCSAASNNGLGSSGAFSVNNSGSPIAKASLSDGTNGTPRTGHTTEPQSAGINFIIKF